MAAPQRNEGSKPAKMERWWWQAAPDPAAAPSAVAIARHRALQEQIHRFDQNAWLAKHAKQPRFQFSGEQKRMLRQWFDALDSDGSGKISVEELEDPMLSIGIVNDTREIEQIVSKLDKDANGQIDFQEFVDFLTPHARHNKGASPQKHELMFQQLTKKMEVCWQRDEVPRKFCSTKSCVVHLAAPELRVLRDQYAAFYGEKAVYPGLHHELYVAIYSRRPRAAQAFQGRADHKRRLFVTSAVAAPTCNDEEGEARSASDSAPGRAALSGAGAGLRSQQRVEGWFL
ncbi:unnamed protein product [Phytophthora fragariaefolia]|uniref:Unnamed protein product n=1 Tax=Phytophthora fragariaefolia TaxID=1490495 RepID=A0A9W6Y8D5_9STRA|nr:unnamed protein product [Phytophthora fragariaefolia]